MNAEKTTQKEQGGSRHRDGNHAHYILVVDDEPRIIQSLVRELSPWAQSQGYSITGVLIGRQALEFVEEHQNEVALVIADIRMPGMSGGDMARELRKRRPNIPIVVLSAYNDVGELNKAEIDSFVRKPWETDHLIGELERALA